MALCVCSWCSGSRRVALPQSATAALTPSQARRRTAESRVSVTQSLPRGLECLIARSQSVSWAHFHTCHICFHKNLFFLYWRRRNPGIAHVYKIWRYMRCWLFQLQKFCAEKSVEPSVDGWDLHSRMPLWLHWMSSIHYSTQFIAPYRCFQGIASGRVLWGCFLRKDEKSKKLFFLNNGILLGFLVGVKTLEFLFRKYF